MQSKFEDTLPLLTDFEFYQARGRDPREVRVVPDGVACFIKVFLESKVPAVRLLPSLACEAATPHVERAGTSKLQDDSNEHTQQQYIWGMTH